MKADINQSRTGLLDVGASSQRVANTLDLPRLEQALELEGVPQPAMAELSQDIP